MYFLLIFVLLGHSTVSILTVATYIYITYSLIKAEMLTSFVKYALGDNPSSSRNLFPIILNWCHHYHAIHSQVHHHLQSWRQHLGQQARAHARWHVHTHTHPRIYTYTHNEHLFSAVKRKADQSLGLHGFEFLWTLRANGCVCLFPLHKFLLKEKAPAAPATIIISSDRIWIRVRKLHSIVE